MNQIYAIFASSPNGFQNLCHTSIVRVSIRHRAEVFLKQKQTLICFETEEITENPRYPTEPKLSVGGPGSEVPPPYLVATGQTGHAVVGLDIGTKFSRIATYEQEKLTLLLDAPIPSLACRLQSGNLIIGSYPTSETVNIVQDFRNLVGTDWYIEAECGFYNADMLTELLISRLATLAQRQLDRPISKAVITTPVSYTSAQRKLLKEAGARAGVEVLQLINEPTAAAFYHCYLNRGFEGKILVYHQGAGTFSVSVMEYHRSGLLEVKSTIGNDLLSSNFFLARLIAWMVAQFNNESGYILKRSPNTLMRLMSAAEQAINDLHTAGQAHIKVTNIDIEQNPVVSSGSKTHAYLMTSITMSEYLSLIEPVIMETLTNVDQVLVEADVEGKEIDQILVCADSRSFLTFWGKFYDRMPNAVIQPCSPAIFPVYGAALQAALIDNSVRDFVIWDVLSEPVLVEEGGNLKQIIARGTPIPITAYHKCESPDSTVNVNVMQGSPERSTVPLAEVTVSNCPPTTAGETKVEVQFIASADGIIDYRARHIGLDSQLPVSIIDGQPVETSNGWSDSKRSRKFDEDRLNRLARKMNMPPLTVLNILHAKGYSSEDIKNGRAIEHMLRMLKKRQRLEKYA